MQRNILYLDGEPVSLLMDYATLVLAEKTLECGVMALAAQLAGGVMPMFVMTEIIALCAKPVQPREGLGERLMSCGVTHVADAVAVLMYSVLNGIQERLEDVNQEMSGALDVLMHRFPDE